MGLLEGKNISFYREEKKILNDINFVVNPNDITSIIGPNGSGKTTFLKLLCGLLIPNNGHIMWEKQDIQCVYKDYLTIIAYLSLYNSSIEHYTVLQNLKFWANLKNQLSLLASVIELFNMEKVLNLQYYKLSAGWKRRVTFARVIISGAIIWLLDEPFTNLDEGGYKLFLNLIISHASKGGIVFIANALLEPGLASYKKLVLS